jgi:Domain of unknown function (DUF4282)
MDVVTKFLSFDKLMGTSLVKIVYFLGLTGIVLGTVGGLLSGLGLLFANFFLGLTTLIMAPVIGVVGMCFLRFACELYIVLFRMGEDIAAMRGTGGINPVSPPAQTLS